MERWFGIITQRAIRRGSFSSVKELIARIEQFVAADNKTKAPFSCTATGLNPVDAPATLLQNLRDETLGFFRSV